jgi:hypothetical protein
VADFRKSFALLALLLAACGEGPRETPNPLDRFVFPTGLELVPVAGRERAALAVVSSNFDLRYAPETGGSVLLVAPEPGASTRAALGILGKVTIPSYGGRAALLSSATCAAWAGRRTEVLVPSRGANVLLRLGVDDAAAAAGTGDALSCGEGCVVGFDPSVADPYDVAVTCRARPGTTDAVEAWVTHLRTDTEAGRLTRLDLDPATGAVASRGLVRVDDRLGATQQLAWDPLRQLLFFTSAWFTLDSAQLRWLEPALDPGAASRTVRELGPAISGSELRGLALSADGTRAYAALRLFARDLAADRGGRPGDLAGGLVVLDASPDALGEPRMQVVRVVAVPVGATEVEVLPRDDGRSEVVAVSSPGSGAIALWDSATGDDKPTAVLGDARVVIEGEGLVRRPFGDSPFGMASEAFTDPADARRKWRLYVASFDRGWITEVHVPFDTPSTPAVARRFGPEAP